MILSENVPIYTVEQPDLRWSPDSAMLALFYSDQAQDVLQIVSRDGTALYALRKPQGALHFVGWTPCEQGTDF